MKDRIAPTKFAALSAFLLTLCLLVVSPAVAWGQAGGLDSGGSTGGELDSDEGAGSDTDSDTGIGSGAAGGSGVASSIPAARRAENLAIIKIDTSTAAIANVTFGDTMIDAVTAKSVERRIRQAEEQGADAIVFEINTPGGEVGAVTEITKAIKASPLYTIAWVNTQAISGGAIIALACDEIVVSPSAEFGDAGIVQIGGQTLAPTERAKVMSPLLAELTDSAIRNGYDEVLLQGIVSLDIETWQVVHVPSGRAYFVTKGEYNQLFGEDPPEDLPSYVAGGNFDTQETGALFADSAETTGTAPAPERGDFVPANPDFTEGMRNDVLRGLDARATPVSKRPNFAEENSADYRFVRYATNGKAFLTLQSNQMIELQLAQATISTQAEIEQYVGAKNVAVLDRTWSETLVKYMTQGTTGMVISGLLIVVFLLGLFIEMVTPGTGVAGVIALMALAGLVVPPLLIGAAGWWVIVAIVLGVLLLGVEVFVTPGLGVPGVLGFISLFTGLVGSFASAGELFPGQGGTDSATRLASSAAIVVLAMFVAAVGMYIFTRYTKHVPLMNRIVLQSEGMKSASEVGTDAKKESLLGAMAAAPPAADPEANPHARVGAIGVAKTRLAPAGSADFDGHLVDVVSERGFVDQGTAVRVLSATRYRVAVTPVDDADSEGDGSPDQESTE